MLKNALETADSLEMLVDSKNAFENCESYAKKQGLAVETQKDGDIFKLRIGRKSE